MDRFESTVEGFFGNGDGYRYSSVLEISEGPDGIRFEVVPRLSSGVAKLESFRVSRDDPAFALASWLVKRIHTDRLAKLTA